MKGPYINSVFLLGVFVYMYYSQARQGSGISLYKIFRKELNPPFPLDHATSPLL